MDKRYLRVAFRIVLHIDDVEVLYKIKDYLKVGYVNTSGTRAYYTLQNVKDIVTVLLPLLDKYTLRTVKFFDYMDFKSMALLLNTGSSRMEGSNLAMALKTIAGMNTGRVFNGTLKSSYDYSLLPIEPLHPY